MTNDNSMIYNSRLARAEKTFFRHNPGREGVCLGKTHCNTYVTMKETGKIAHRC